jgi:hypothetical protein
MVQSSFVVIVQNLSEVEAVGLEDRVAVPPTQAARGRS